MMHLYNVGDRVRWRDEGSPIFPDQYAFLEFIRDYKVKFGEQPVIVRVIENRNYTHASGDHPQIVFFSNDRGSSFSGWWFVPVSRPGFILDDIE